MKKKSVLLMIIAVIVLLFACVQLGLSHNESWGTYDSVEEFEKATSIKCLRMYDIYDYVLNDQYTDIKDKDITIKSTLLIPEIDYRIIDQDNDVTYRIEKGDATGEISLYDNHVTIPLSIGEVHIGDKEWDDENYINVVYRWISEGFNDIYIEFDIKKNDLSRDGVDQKIVNYMEDIIKNNPDYFSVQ